MRRLPGLADHGLSDGGNSRGSHRFVSGLAENTCMVRRLVASKKMKVAVWSTQMYPVFCGVVDSGPRWNAPRYRPN